MCEICNECCDYDYDSREKKVFGNGEEQLICEEHFKECKDEFDFFATKLSELNEGLKKVKEEKGLTYDIDMEIWIRIPKKRK